jgi:hypothetical protein
MYQELWLRAAGNSMTRKAFAILGLLAYLYTGLWPVTSLAQDTGSKMPTNVFELNQLFFKTAETSALGERSGLTVEDVAARIVGVVLSMTGIVFVSLIIYGGYLWGTARGNTEKVETGRKLIFEATIGVIIVFGAFILTAFVIQQVGQATMQNDASYYFR